MISFSPESPKRLYIYKFYKRGEDRLQSAWGTLSFSRDILGFFFINSVLYILFNNGSGQSIETLDFTPGIQDEGSDHTTLLDRRLDEAGVTSVYNSNTESTTITLPYALTPGSEYVVVRKSGGTVPVINRLTSSLTVRGDVSSEPIWVGESYTMTYGLSRPALRETKQNGAAAVVVPGRFQVLYGLFSCNDTMAFDAFVESHGRESFKQFRAVTLNVDGTVGTLYKAKDFVFRLPVFAKNDEVKITITNSTPYPCALLSVDWEAKYSSRAQRA